MASPPRQRHDTTMTPWWVDLLREQERSGFADLRGTRASVRVPVSDRILTRIITERLPPKGTVREIDLEAFDGDECRIRVRLRPAFLPSLDVRLVIERQPRLPESPVLVARLISKGLASLATGPLGSAFRLPQGFILDNERLLVDLSVLARRYGAGETLAYLSTLELHTERGRVVVVAEAELPPRT
jgi:hypothetical protein